MRRSLEILLLVLGDVIASAAALGVALYVRTVYVPDGLAFPIGAKLFFLMTVILAAAWAALYAFVGLYSEWGTRARMGEIMWLVKATLFGGAILFLLTLDPTRPFTETRIVLLTYGATMVAVAAFGRVLVRQFQGWLFAHGYAGRSAIIVGAGEKAKDLYSRMRRAPEWGFRVAGFVEPNGHGPQAREPIRDTGLPVLGRLDDLRDLIVAHGTVEVMIAEPTLSHQTVLDAVVRCDGLKVNFSVVPDIYDVVFGRGSPGHIFDMPLVPLFPSAMPVWQIRTKRIVDIVASAIGIVAGMPVWGAVAAAIWFEDRGPVVYSQERVGLGGRTFRVHKFRSMVPDAEKASGPVWAKDGDPRVTRVGNFLRRTRIDEIPQLWNVLRGEMSLVGPRPERPYFVERLAREIPLYRRRLHVKPGITGWAQTKRAYDASLDDVREKLRYDLYYIENMSLRFDVLILLRTVWVTFSGRGAR